MRNSNPLAPALADSSANLALLSLLTGTSTLLLKIHCFNMKISLYLVAVAAGTTLAYPGVGNLLLELAKRQTTTPTPELIGDLIAGATTSVGNQVKNCLLGTAPCQDLTPKVSPHTFPTPNSAKLTACVSRHTNRQISTASRVSSKTPAASGITSKPSS
jgi:hypothetical protein